MVYLGLDLGSKTLGVSVSDRTGIIASSLEVLRYNEYSDLLEKLDKIVEDRKVDVEITADKEKYYPGDEVTLTVKTTNNGKPVKSFVNVSVVNEAVFQVTEDITSILEEVYANKSYPVYTYSTFKDDIMNSSGRRRRRRWRKPQRLWRYSML